LNGDQFATYYIDDLKNGTGNATVEIRDRQTEATTSTLSLDNISMSGYRVGLTNCYIYFIKDGLDFKVPGFDLAVELWRSDFSGKEEKVLTLTDWSKEQKEASLHYEYIFKVDPFGKYLVLNSVTTTPTSTRESLVIKNLATLKDLFTLPAADLVKAYPDLAGDFMMLDWSSDGRYFWANIYEEAYVDGWIRVDSKDWSFQVFVAPEGVLGGYPLNLETGWVPLIPGAFWSGFQEGDDQVAAERKADGSTADLYLYNIFTKQKILVEDTNDPIWRGLNASWLSTSTLRYSLPDGTMKTYTI
jgi:hypothetical protein